MSLSSDLNARLMHSVFIFFLFFTGWIGFREYENALQNWQSLSSGLIYPLSIYFRDLSNIINITCSMFVVCSFQHASILFLYGIVWTLTVWLVVFKTCVIDNHLCLLLLYLQSTSIFGHWLQALLIALRIVSFNAKPCKVKFQRHIKCTLIIRFSEDYSMKHILGFSSWITICWKWFLIEIDMLDALLEKKWFIKNTFLNWLA